MNNLINSKLAASYGETYREVYDWVDRSFKKKGWNKNYTFKPYRKQVARNNKYFSRAKRQYNLANYYYHTRERAYYYP